MVSTRAKRELIDNLPFHAAALEKRGFSGDGESPSSKNRKKRKTLQDAEAEKPLNSVARARKGLLPCAETNFRLEQSAVVKQAMESLSNAKVIAQGIEYLKECDVKLKLVIEAAGDLPEFERCKSPFLSLARGIVYQQLVTSAAAAIHKRLIDLCGDESSFTPTVIAQLAESDLRSIGLSARKVDYIRDLAKKFIEGGLSDATIMLMEDEMLVSTLTAVKGIGMWSVHMFMIFALHRPDVLPTTDLGVRKGFMKLYGLKSLPSSAEMEKLSESWRPYRTLGAWYLWHVKESSKAPRKALKKASQKVSTGTMKKS